MITIGRKENQKIISYVENGFFTNRSEFIRFSLYYLLLSNGTEIENGYKRPLEHVPFHIPLLLLEKLKSIYTEFYFSEICRTAITNYLLLIEKKFEGIINGKKN